MMLKQRSITLATSALMSVGSAEANVTFNLLPEPGTPQLAIEGFNAAANLWSTVLADNITINLEIGYAPLGPGVVGTTSSEFIERSYSEVLVALGQRRTSADDISSYAALQPAPAYSRVINHTSNNPYGPDSATPYVDTMDRVGLTRANAKALGFLAQDGSLDATIRFSSALSYDFSHGSTIAPGQLDFVGAAAHEIGHVLGFFSGVDDIDTFGGLYPGDEFSSNLIDLFRYSSLSLADGPGFTDYTADSRDKFFSVNGGATVVALFSTGVDNGDGYQASHWKDNMDIGLMDPTITYGERADISFTDLRVFDVLGYTLIPEPVARTLLGLGLLILVVRPSGPESE